jgi:hypothetical protein
MKTQDVQDLGTAVIISARHEKKNLRKFKITEN